MCAMVVEVGPEIEQLVLEICSCPEERLIQILASNGPDQPFHERMGQGNVGDGTDLCSIKGKVKKKNFSRGRKFSTFAAHLIEQDLF